MTIQPFFSIIIPTYNRAHLISKAVESVLSQQFTAYEIIVVDDGSTDNTEEIVNSFNNPKISYYKKINSERGAARNFGWEKAIGKYTTFLDSDDLFYSYHLQAAFEKINQLNHPFCLAQAFEIKDNETGKVIWPGYKSKQSQINQALFKGNFLACFGVFIKTEIFFEVKFEEERKFAGSEDWLLWLRLAARYPFYFNNKITGALLHHEERSVLMIEESSLLFRAPFIKEKLQQDEVFRRVFGTKGINKAYAHVLGYVSLNLAIAKKNKEAVLYWLKTLKVHPAEVLQKRTLGIIKTILFK